MLLMVVLVPQRVWAISGSGTSSDPYEISSASDLALFQQYVENGNSGIYGKLTADITLTSSWTRIGRSDRRFKGNFDGQGHTISGMDLAFLDYEHGLFGYVENATIKNFTLAGTMTSSADGNHSHGSVVGAAHGTTVIENVTSSVNITITHTGFQHVGGIVGHIYDNTIVRGCTYTGTLSGGPIYDCLGGIVGYADYGSSTQITNCFFNGTVSTTSTNSGLNMGGIVGYVNDTGNFIGLTNCYSDGTLTKPNDNTSSNVGAIAGMAKDKAPGKFANNTYLSGTASRLSNKEGSTDFASSNKAITISVNAGNGGSIEQSYVNPTSTTATQLQVKANPSTGYHLNNWSDSGNQTHNVSLANNVNITANFGEHTYGNLITDNAATCTTSGTGHRNCTHTGCNAQKEETISALGHGTTGYTPTYTWGGTYDNATCSFTLKCNGCNGNVVSGYSLTTSKVQAKHTNATCTTAGNERWTATGSYSHTGDQSYTGTAQTKDYSIPATGHGHTNGYTPTYTWGGTHSAATCSFTLKCNDCNGNVVSGNSLTTSKVQAKHIDADCTEAGNERWTATGSYSHTGDQSYTGTAQNKDYSIPALGHGTTGYTPTYTWDGTYDNATCSFTLECNKCSNYVVFSSELTTSKVQANHRDAACTDDGNETWTATGSYSHTGDQSYNGTAQNKDYPIPATGDHAFNNTIDPHHTLCTVCEHTFFRYTSKDNAVVSPATPANLKDKDDNTLTIVSNDKGVMELNGKLTKIGDWAFYYCENFIGDLIIPVSVTSIGTSAFDHCAGFTGNLVIPNSVTSIGTSAFDHCAGFTGNLVFPNSVTSIGAYAFSDCAGLSGTVFIPHSVTSIGAYAFINCNFTTIRNEATTPQTYPYIIVTTSSNVDLLVPASAVATYKDDECWKYFKSISCIEHDYSQQSTNEAYVKTAATCGTGGMYYYSCIGCGDNEHNDSHTFSTPATGDHAFDNTTDPHHTLCTVCDHTFFRYTSIENAVVDPKTPASLKDKDDNTLTIVSNTNVAGEGVIEFDKPLVTIGEQAFYQCTSFTGSLNIPVSVTSLGTDAFAECINFNGSLTIPNSVTSLGTGAFRSCWGLSGSLAIPESVTSIGDKAFAWCEGFNGSLNIPESVTSIGGEAFSGCTGFNGSLTIPESVTNIGYNAFSQCTNFTEVEFASVPYINNGNAFLNVTSNKTLRLTDADHPFVANTTANVPEFTSAKYIRTLPAGKYGTIVLPFVPTNVSDYKFYELTSVDGTSLKFSEVASENVAAGKPYLYENASATPATEMTSAEKPEITVVVTDPATTSGWQMKGTFQGKEFADPNAYIYVLSNNQLLHSIDGTAKVLPFRAYFEGVSLGAGVKMEIVIDGENPTKIDLNKIEGMEDLSGEIYDLSGRRVQNPQRGIYIVNGKKVMF